MLSNVIGFVTRTRYRKDIMMILFVKAILLFILWFFFFAQPVDHRLTKTQLIERYVGSL